MHKIFKKIPPEELTLRYFDCFGVKGFFDEVEFTSSCITTEAIVQLDLLLIELEPYYTKYKKFMITRIMTARHYLQVLRNLCQVHGFIFYTKTTDSGTSYRILNTNNPDTAFFHIMLKNAKKYKIPETPFIISFSD
jgi:hypothetical protein